MKNVKLILILLCVALAACSSDDEQEQNTDGRKLRQLTIADVPVTRATLTESGKTLGATWDEDDVATYFNVSVFDEGNMNYGNLTASSSEETSTFKGTVLCKKGDDIALFYPGQTEDFPTTGNDRGKFTISLEGQDGTLETVATKYHYVYGVANVESVTGSMANATIDNMQSLLAVCKFTFTDGTTTIPVKTLTINYYDNSHSYAIGYPGSATLTPTENVSTLELGYPSQNDDTWEKEGLSVTLGTETTDGVYVALFGQNLTDYMHFTVEDTSGNTYTGTAKATLKEGEYVVATGLKLTKQAQQ